MIKKLICLLITALITVPSAPRTGAEAGDFSVGVRGSKIRLDDLAKETETGRGFYVRQKVGDSWMVETAVDFYNFNFSQEWGVLEGEIIEAEYIEWLWFPWFYDVKTKPLPRIPDENFTLTGNIDVTIIWLTAYYFLADTSEFSLYLGGGMNYLTTDYEYDRHTFTFNTWTPVYDPYPYITDYEPIPTDIELRRQVTTGIDHEFAPHVAVGMAYALTDFLSVSSSVLYRFGEAKRESKYKAGFRQFIENSNWEEKTPGEDDISLCGWSANLGLELHF
jgi:outer membrane protein W